MKTRSRLAAPELRTRASVDWRVGVAIALVLSSAAVAGEAIGLECAASKVGRYEKIEFRLEVPRAYAQPFDPAEVEVDLELTTSLGQRFSLPAFFCQDYEQRRIGSSGQPREWLYPKGLPVWKARFAPSEIGVHQAVATVKDHEGTRRSAPVSFECVPSESHGFVRVSRQDPRFFEFSDGQPFFAIGQNLAFIGPQQYVTLPRAETIFARLADQGANYLRVWTCCEDWAMAIEARKSAWGRSWDWHPPLAPLPDGEGAEDQCLKLPGDGTPLNVDPSYPVTVRPNTRYAVAGRFRTAGEAALRLEVLRTRTDRLTSAPAAPWAMLRHEFETGLEDYWLGPMRLRSEGTGTVWVAGLSLKEQPGGPELLWEADVNRPPRGFYNPVDCHLLDRVVAAAEQDGLYLQLCLLTRDLYMSALKDPRSAAYQKAVADARKFFRYAVARWGYSTHVAAWEYWNEMDPGLPTEAFYAALGEYLDRTDAYHHLRTTSTWGPSARDCRQPTLDIADVHFYLRPSDRNRLGDEVEAVFERTRWLRDQAPRKPAHLGEFGLANEQWQPRSETKQSREFVDFHNALWASALSGASGTALFWWWERLDQLDAYPTYRPLRDFLAEVPWNSGGIQPATVVCSDERLRVAGLQARHRVWLWLFHRAAAWSSVVVEKRPPEEVAGALVELRQLPAGSYRVQWWDTRAGQVLKQEQVPAGDGGLHLSVPPFTRDIACKVGP